MYLADFVFIYKEGRKKKRKFLREKISMNHCKNINLIVKCCLLLDKLNYT